MASTWPPTGPNSTAAYEQSTPRIEVTIRVRPERVGRLRDVVGPRVMDEAEPSAEADPDGWLGFRLRLDWPDEIAGHLLEMGPDIEVLEPPELRVEILELADRVVRRYASA